MITHAEWLAEKADGIERRLERARKLRGRAKEAYYDAAVQSDDIPRGIGAAPSHAWQALATRCTVLRKRWEALRDECEDLAARLREVDSCYA